MSSVLYKPVGIVAGMIAGFLASKLFELVWGRISESDPPDPEDRDGGWGEIVASAAISGAIFAAVRAVVRRGGAKGFERATGVWPGSEKDD